MERNVIEKKDVVIIIVKEQRLDAHNSNDLKSEVKGFFDSGKKNVLVDLGNVRFIDSSGLGALVSGFKSAISHQGTLKLSALQPQVKSMFELTRLHRVFDIFANTEEALDSLLADEAWMPKNSIEIDITVPNQTRYLSLIGKIGEDIGKGLKSYSGEKEALAYHLNLVLTEAMVNAIKHAHTDDPEKSVHIFINITEDEIQMKIYDSGQGFDINTVPTPDFEKLEDAGRGIFIIRNLMDSVSYRKLDDMNVLEMIKKLK